MEGFHACSAENVATRERVLRVVLACAEETERMADEVGWVSHPNLEDVGQSVTVDQCGNRFSRKLLPALRVHQQLTLCEGESFFNSRYPTGEKSNWIKI